MRIIGFIPARVHSTRFPGKPLADINGKPMIVRVWERAKCARDLSAVYVVTDSEEILRAVRNHGGEGFLTRSDHVCGTDRIAQAAEDLGLGPHDIAVNIQGDQPLFDPLMVEEVIAPLMRDPSIPMSTLIYRIVRDEEITDTNAVKTVIDRDGFALYFSRATIPNFGGSDPEPVWYKHHGIYAYRCDFLRRFAQLPQGFLERAERLEQLRALEHGFRIKCVVTEKDSIEVDTHEDLARVRKEYCRQGGDGSQ